MGGGKRRRKGSKQHFLHFLLYDYKVHFSLTLALQQRRNLVDVQNKSFDDFL